MPMQPQEQATLNVKLVHFTKQNSPDEPVQVAFAVTDDQGKEEIITGEVPFSGPWSRAGSHAFAPGPGAPPP